MHTILIVDDEERLRKALGRSLAGEQLKTLTADSAEQALKLLAKKRVDLVITDLVMPNMDGMALVRRIRQRKSNTKIIIITAYGSDESMQEAETLGVSAYLAKPFDLSDLKSRVNDLLQAKASARAWCWPVSAVLHTACSAAGKTVGGVTGASCTLAQWLKPRNVIAAAGKAAATVSSLRFGLSKSTSTLKRHEVNHK